MSTEKFLSKTKMVYHSRNNKINGKKKFVFFLVVLAVIAFFYFGKFFFITGPLNYVGKPLWWLKNSSVEIISDGVGLIRTKKNLIDENESLKDELNRVNSQFLLSKLLMKENIELKKTLGRVGTESKSVLANVLAKPNLSPYDSLILDIGKDHGVNKGDKVIVNNIVIGEVEVVFLKTVKARLYSFPNDTVEVAVGFNKIIGSAKGKGGGNFEIKFPRNVAIEKGDVVVLPEMDLFVLGVVEDIYITPEDPLQTILFKTPVNIFELRWVQILQD